ncbi:ankyrin repeat domain-containing protein [Mycena olivaceomarginata]|nr:ankyrin repeat domain-containing protein [Mycena olivaceomarginata]
MEAWKSRRSQIAAHVGNLDIVNVLLDDNEKGAEVNAQGGAYGTALQAAARAGNHDVVKLLLDNRADINAQGASHSLQFGESVLISAQGGQFGTVLQSAAFFGNPDTVELLLGRGADVNANRNRLFNSKVAMSGLGHEDIVRFLLENGAELSA